MALVTVSGMDRTWDCIVVGGGAAGLSAALVLGRARVRTLVIDAGAPSNAAAEGIGGLLGWDGRPPAELYAAGRRELDGYPAVEVRRGEVVRGERLPGDGGFLLDLANAEPERARRVVLATGMDYRRPALPGLRERWGRSVFHCPFCHGWEVRDQALGVLDGSPAGLHRALLLRRWSDDVTLLADGPHELAGDDLARLRAAGVEVDERPVAGLRGPGDALEAVVFEDGSDRACEGLLVAVRLHQRSALAEQLGAATLEPTPLVAGAIEVDPRWRTTVPGLAAAGDVSVPMPSVANAIAAGSTAAATIVHGLMEEAWPAVAAGG